MNAHEDQEFDRRLRESLGSPGQADFDRWRTRHRDAIAFLNPVVTKLHRQRRRMIMRVTSLAAAAIVLIAIVSFFSSQQESFAQTLEKIDNAKTIKWTVTTYTRFYSKDGQRTWLRPQTTVEMAYRSPNLYRFTRYDKDGNVLGAEIVDARTNKALQLNMKTKTATWLNEPTNQFVIDGPFSGLKELLTSKPLEFVGQKELNGARVNVFRYRRDINGLPDEKRSRDIWLDAETKTLVRFYDPGADSFDPDTDPDRNKPAEETFSKGRLVGSVWSDIEFDADMDPALFSLTPPEGFEVVVQDPQPVVSEEELIEWLGAAARFNEGVFYDDARREFDLARYNAAAAKDNADRTEAEKKIVELQYKHMLNRNSPVIGSFANEHTFGGRFRYLGKGVKLGSADRIVMYYKLKSTGAYRAIYGDLTVKDIAEEDLPLPVE